MAIGIHYLYTGNFHARLVARKTNETKRLDAKFKPQWFLFMSVISALRGRREGSEAQPYRMHWRPTVSALTDRKSRAETRVSVTINQNYCGAISVCFFVCPARGLFIKLMANAIAARLDRQADWQTGERGQTRTDTDTGTAGVCAVRANNAHCLISLLETSEKRSI